MARRVLTIPELKRYKGKGDPLVMITAYDLPSGQMVVQGDVDLVLVGDSLGNVLLGYDSTVPVTMDNMIHHVKAARSGIPDHVLIADMPFLSYGITQEESLRNAGRFVKECGANAVKLEGGRKVASTIERIVSAEIPVMGHLGLTPQAVNRMGGYRVQGKTADSILDLIKDAEAIVQAGVFAMVLEGIPSRVAKRLTEMVPVPTIGIGAGSGCDGQVLVFHDLLGLSLNPPPKFVKEYAHLAETGIAAIREYCKDVRDRSFPGESHSYKIPKSVDIDSLFDDYLGES